MGYQLITDAEDMEIVGVMSERRYAIKDFFGRNYSRGEIVIEEMPLREGEYLRSQYNQQMSSNPLYVPDAKIILRPSSDSSNHLSSLEDELKAITEKFREVGHGAHLVLECLETGGATVQSGGFILRHIA